MLNKIIFPLTLLLTPLLFWTLTPNFFVTPKQILLVLAVFLLILHWAFTLATSRSLETSSSPLRFGLASFVALILLNLVLNKTGRAESLIGPASLYLSLSAWTYFLTCHSDTRLHKSILSAFLASTLILALHTIAQLTLLYKLDFLPLFMQSRAFTLTGNSLTTLILIAIGGALSLSQLRPTINHKPSTIYHLLSTIVHLIAFVALGALILPGQELALNILPLTASWNIALDAMKMARSFFFGVGLSNFGIFYNSVKPLFLNATSFWNILPTASSSEFLGILTTTGVLGFLSFISLPLITLRSKINHLPAVLSAQLMQAGQPFKLLFILSGLALIFSPGSLPLLLIFFTTLGVLNSSSPVAHPLTRLASLILSLSVLALVITGLYYSYRAVAGDLNMRQAQIALAAGDGKLVYEKNIAAIELVPTLASYRLSYSQVNLALAAALSQKETLEDSERENITQLLSQAIREAKLAVNLAPGDARAWQNLASLYRNLVNVAEGSDQFAIQSYSQAVALDPANPAPRLEYGGFLYQLKDYTRAQSEFQTTIQLKADYANAYYNLAKLLEATGSYQNAYLTMQKAISLLGPESSDLARANAELDAIKVKLPPTPTPSPTPSTINDQPSTISLPSPLPSPIDGGPIDLTPTSPAPNL